MSEETEEGLEGYANQYEVIAAQQAAGTKTRLRIISWMLEEVEITIVLSYRSPGWIAIFSDARIISDIVVNF